MADALIHILLLLQEEFNVLLLNRKGQREALNRERNLLGIVVEPKQIHLADDRLDTALELTHTRLPARIVLHDKLKDLLADTDLLMKARFLERGGQQILLGNEELLLDAEPLTLDVVHAVAQNGIHLLVVVV